MLSTPEGRREEVRLKEIPSRVVSNYVLVKPYNKNISRKTEAGISIVAPKFANQTDHVDRIGEVVRAPDSLFFSETKISMSQVLQKKEGTHLVMTKEGMQHKPYYKKRRVTVDKYKYTNTTLEWKTDVELKEGDTVLFNYQESINATIYWINDEKYYLMKYSEIYARKRDGEITPINGFLICESQSMKKTSSLDHFSEKKQDPHKLKVAYISKPIEKYFGEEGDCNTEIKIGDIVLRDDPKLAPKTEYLYHAEFFNELKEYIFIQRRYLLGVLVNQN